MNTSSLYYAILFFASLLLTTHGETQSDLQLAVLLRRISSAPASRAEELKSFAKSNAGTGAAMDAKLLAGQTLLKAEVAGSQMEVFSLFKEVMKEGRGTWREAVATVLLTNAAHVSGQHESVRELAVYSLKNRTLDKLDSSEIDISDAVKTELNFDPIFYRDLMLVMLALAYENLKDPDEAGRIFARITHPSILASYPNGVGTPPAPQSKLPISPETTPQSKGSQPIPKPTPAARPRSPEQAPETKSAQPAPGEEPTSSTPWSISIIVVVVVAALGLLWLLLKRRS